MLPSSASRSMRAALRSHHSTLLMEVCMMWMVPGGKAVTVGGVLAAHWILAASAGERQQLRPGTKTRVVQGEAGDGAQDGRGRVMVGTCVKTQQ